MASPEAKNLEAISKAIDQHNSNCPFPAAEVRMNPFEVERLGWDTIRGLPVVPDGEIGTGRFRIVCSRDLEDNGLEITEAVGKELETVGANSELTRSLFSTVIACTNRANGDQTLFQKSMPNSSAQRWTSMLSWTMSPVQIRMPITIRITPPTATISW